MSQTLFEKHEAVVVEMGRSYLESMELELGRKYKDRSHVVNAGLSQEQYAELKAKHAISDEEFAELYAELQAMKPTEHLNNVMAAFTASGGNVDIEPLYDEQGGRLKVIVSFVINDKKRKKIEGLSPAEDIILRMNAMMQVEGVLSDPDSSPEF